MAANAIASLVLLSLLSAVVCTPCVNPKVVSSYFTTQDATIVLTTAYISEFTVACESGELSQLYADITGTIVPASMTGNNKFQVSWTEEHRLAQKGLIRVKVYDEETYNVIKKALRAGEDISGVAPFFEVVVNHTGAFNGPWLKNDCPVCYNPKVSYSFYTNDDARIVTDIAYVTQFHIDCGDSHARSLYAELNGILIPITHLGNKDYQLSWTEAVDNAREGIIILNIFDEDGYNDFKKQLRNGGDYKDVQPLFAVKIEHPGAFSGPWLKSEFVAGVVASVIAFIAIVYKQHLTD